MFDHSNDKRDTQSGTVAVVCTNEHVQFLWATISLDISCEQNSQTLLKEIVELWVTMRGHSMASMVVEAYKRQKAKSTKGAKGIRKQLKLGESSHHCSIHTLQAICPSSLLSSSS